VTITRRIAVPPERVFQAFVDPELLVKWQFPARSIRLEVASFEARPNGAYRFRFHNEDGSVDAVSGTFREVVPPKRLVFTWTWDTTDPDGGVETQVSVDLSPDTDGTRVHVTHERLPTATSRRRHEQGWTGALGHLAELVE
jgi:uncharacterized protein YndB with AHSA1/START domain